jgi:TctA family transporter
LTKAIPNSQEEVDDQFRALLEGLRTTLPGVQVLFAFLLVFPFYDRFETLSAVEQALYYVALLSSATSSILLIAPSVHQRLRTPVDGVPRRSPLHVLRAAQLSTAGTNIFVIALISAVYLVASLGLGATIAAFAAVLVAMVVGWSWFYIPLVQFRRE